MDTGQRGDAEADRARVDHGVITGDHPGRLQLPHAFVHGGRRQPDGAPEIGIGGAPVDPQRRDDLPIQLIHALTLFVPAIPCAAYRALGQRGDDEALLSPRTPDPGSAEKSKGPLLSLVRLSNDSKGPLLFRTPAKTSLPVMRAAREAFKGHSGCPICTLSSLYPRTTVRVPDG